MITIFENSSSQLFTFLCNIISITFFARNLIDYIVLRIMWDGILVNFDEFMELICAEIRKFKSYKRYIFILKIYFILKIRISLKLIEYKE